MTVTTRDFENTQFADGVAVDFDFTFKALLEEFVVVVNVTDDTTYTPGSGYAVAIDDSGVGGTVTFVTPPDDGDEIHIYRLIPPYQLLHLINEQDLDAETFEFVFDKLTILIQQIERNVDFINAVTIPGLIALIDSILNLTGFPLGPGAGRVEGGIPVWTSAGAATLSGGLVGTLADDILKWNGTAWVASQGVPVLSLGTVTAPGVTNINGIVSWTDATGTAIGTIPAGIDGQVLTGHTGLPATFEDLTDLLGDIYPGATAGQILTFDGAGNAAPATPAAAPVGTDAFFSATSSPRGQKIWVLTNPGAYATGGKQYKAKTSGSSDNVIDGTSGLYLKLTSGTGLVAVKAYSSTDDPASARQAFPLWLTRILTGPGTTLVRYYIGFGNNNLTNVEGGIISKSSALFRFDTSLGDTNWMAVTCTSGGVTTVQDTLVPFAASSRFIFAIDMVELDHVKFFVNNVEKNDIATNLPDTTDFLDWMVVCKPLSAAVRSVAVGPVCMTHG